MKFILFIRFIQVYYWFKRNITKALRADKRPYSYPEMQINPDWNLGKKSVKKANLKFQGETKVPRPMRRKAKKQLPFDHETKKTIRV